MRVLLTFYAIVIHSLIIFSCIFMKSLQDFFTQKLSENWKAGLTVSLINIPLSISLAVASGGTPLQGIITGIWGPIIASFFCGSKHNVFWVAGALTSIVMAFVVSQWPQGIALIPLLALISGLYILGIYFLWITKYLTLIPTSVLHGFLASVGITIALGQLSGALGLNEASIALPQHKEIYLNVIEVFKYIDQTNLAAFGLFGVSLASILASKKYFPTFPIVIVLSIVGIGVGVLSSHHMIPHILLLWEKYKGVSFSLWSFPSDFFGISDVTSFLSVFHAVALASLTITLVAVVETLISAKIAEKMTKRKFDQEKEILGLALSNIGAGAFWGLPVSAVFIRTALNIKSGGTHQMSGFLVGLYTLGLSALLYTQALVYFPFPVISAILMSIALGLIEIGHIKKLYRLERKAFYIMLVTTVLSVLEDPLIGILTWIVFALFIMLKRFYHSDTLVNIFRGGEFIKKVSLKDYIQEQQKGDTAIVKLPWGVNYMTSENLLSQLREIELPEHLIFSFSSTGDIDVDGVETLEEAILLIRSRGVHVYIAGVSDDARDILERTGFYEEKRSRGRVFESVSEALKKLA